MVAGVALAMVVLAGRVLAVVALLFGRGVVVVVGALVLLLVEGWVALVVPRP